MRPHEINDLAALAEAEQARRHLPDFLTRLEPAYERAAHADMLCQRLEALARGEIRRLATFLPPRNGKTLHISQAFPAWFLGWNPTAQVILASYAADLAENNSRRARNYLAHPRYPFSTRLAADSTAANLWHTSENGSLLATGVEGGITGFGADLLIVDDPVKDRHQADSEVARNRLWDWYTQAALPRLMPGGRVVLTMARWHEDDLAGRILDAEGGEDWEVLRLPALAEEHDPLGRAPGEALWPQKFDVDDLPSVARGVIDSRAFEALYQQRPTALEGGILRPGWLQARYTELPPRLRVVQAVDTAFKTGASNSYSVIATWATDETNFFVVDVHRDRVEFPELVRRIEREAEIYSPDEVLVEDAASGQSVLQHLRYHTRVRAIGVRPSGTKESRLAAVSGLFEAGRIRLPEGSSWVPGWVAEHVNFPAGRFDDQVDTTSLVLGWLTQPQPRIRVLSAPSQPRRLGGYPWY